MSAIDVRRAEVGDAARIADQSAVLGYPVAGATMAGRLERLLASDRDVILVAALSSGDLAGWIHGAEQDLLETGRRCEIAGLVVSPAIRRQGVARRLIAAVESWARDRGLDEISVRSNVLRAESHPFYEALGYTRVKTQHAYRKTVGAGSAPHDTGL